MSQATENVNKSDSQYVQNSCHKDNNKLSMFKIKVAYNIETQD